MTYGFRKYISIPKCCVLPSLSSIPLKRRRIVECAYKTFSFSTTLTSAYPSKVAPSLMATVVWFPFAQSTSEDAVASFACVPYLPANFFRASFLACELTCKLITFQQSCVSPAVQRSFSHRNLAVLGLLRRMTSEAPPITKNSARSEDGSSETTDSAANLDVFVGQCKRTSRPLPEASEGFAELMVILMLQPNAKYKASSFADQQKVRPFSYSRCREEDCDSDHPILTFCSLFLTPMISLCTLMVRSSRYLCYASMLRDNSAGLRLSFRAFEALLR